jgi:LysM repeat protein
MPHHRLILALFTLFGFALVMTAAAQEGVPPTAVPTFTATPTRFALEARYTLPITSDVSYVIQVRDTLDQVAAGFDIQLACLFETNDLTGREIIQPGQQIVISASCPAYDGVLPVANPRLDAPGRTGEDGTYAVRPNDTLDTIAQQLNVSVVALQLVNDIEDPNRIRAGDFLVIPEDAPPYGTFPAIEDETLEERQARGGAGSTTYVVQPNDTLDTIGQALDVSVEQLRQVNNITNPLNLQPGFALVIPADPAPYGVFPAIDSDANTRTEARLASGELQGERYVVQPNDTLDTIAQAFGVSVVAIRQANEIDSALDLRPGRVLVIPADAPPYGIFPSIGEPAGSQVAAGREYVIQPGDTLDHIAALFNVDTLCLIERNGVEIDPRFIRAGQVVGIPADCPPYAGFDFVPENPPTQVQPAPRATQSQDAVDAPPVEATPTPTFTVTSEAETADDSATEEPQATEEVAG